LIKLSYSIQDHAAISFHLSSITRKSVFQKHFQRSINKGFRL
jgi:hypothetical protein